MADKTYLAIARDHAMRGPRIGRLSGAAGRRREQRELERLNLALRVLSQCNRALVRAASERELREGVCPREMEIRKEVAEDLAYGIGALRTRAAQEHALRALQAERKRHEAVCERHASHDALTGLANRGLLSERLRQAIRHAQRSGRAVALLLLNLDRFKRINDSLGHHGCGDTLLRGVAQRLRS